MLIDLEALPVTLMDVEVDSLLPEFLMLKLWIN
jgi:hypothetical protein